MYKGIMTKNDIKARIMLAINLAEQAKGLLDEVCDKLAPSAEDDIFDICNRIQDCETTDIDEVMIELEEAGYFEELGIPDGKEIKPAQVKVSNCLEIEVRTPLLDGDYLEAHVGNSDYGPQAGVVYVSKDEDLIDLVMAEQKQSEYAKQDRESGEDITIYSWGNPLTEEYTSKDLIRKDMIDEALAPSSQKSD